MEWKPVEPDYGSSVFDALHIGARSRAVFVLEVGRVDHGFGFEVRTAAAIW